MGTRNRVGIGRSSSVLHQYAIQCRAGIPSLWIALEPHLLGLVLGHGGHERVVGLLDLLGLVHLQDDLGRRGVRNEA